MSDLLTIQDPLAEAAVTIHILVSQADDSGQRLDGRPRRERSAERSPTRPVTIAVGRPGQAPVILTAVLDDVLAAAPIRQAWLAYGTQAELAPTATDFQAETESQDEAEATAERPPAAKPKARPQSNLDTLF